MSSSSTSSKNLHLIHGSDTFALFSFLRRTQTRYAEKFPELPITVLEGDELGSSLSERVRDELGAISLFSDSRLVLIKRPLDTNVLLNQVASLGVNQDVVIVWHEGRYEGDIPDVFAVKECEIVSESMLIKRFVAELESEGLSMSEGAEKRLRRALALELERQRGDLRLRAGEKLKRDERGWYLQNLLIRLKAAGVDEISETDIDEYTAADVLPTAVFSLVDAVLAGDSRSVGSLLSQWQKQATADAAYYTALSLISTRARKLRGRVLLLVSEADLLVKNGFLDAGLCLRALTAAISQNSSYIVQPKLLWKASISRFG